MSIGLDKIIYGTYQVSPLQVTELVNHAISLGITHFDTAQLYGNEKLFKQLSSNHTVTTKIFHANTVSQLENRINKSQRRFGDRRINTMLLHREMPNNFWHVMSNLIKQNKVDHIGVSNYSITSLVSLMEYCEINNLIKPQVLQIEIHPLIDQNILLNYCKNNGIIVQGHSVLLQGKNIYHASENIQKSMINLTAKYNSTSWQILLSWALNRCDFVCIGTKSFQHMEELVNATKIILDGEDIDEINIWHTKLTHVFYKNTSKKYNIDEMVAKLNNDLNIMQKYSITGTYSGLSNVCDIVPITGDDYKSVGREIASRIFPDTSLENAHRKLREEVKKLRQINAVESASRRMFRKGLKQCTEIRTSGKYFDFIINPVPMPVEKPEASEFEPIFNFVKNTENITEDIIFNKGTMFKDGRLDLCKQVVGPDSIGKLCEVTMQSKIVKHFLLGCY